MGLLPLLTALCHQSLKCTVRSRNFCGTRCNCRYRPIGYCHVAKKIFWSCLLRRSRFISTCVRVPMQTVSAHFRWRVVISCVFVFVVLFLCVSFWLWNYWSNNY